VERARRWVTWALSGGLVACAVPDAPRDAERAPAPAVATSPAPPALAEVEPVPEEPDAPMPRPARGRLGAAVALNAGCVSCHEREAADWRGSLHQRSDLDPAYQQAFAIEPGPFCRGCHAPEGDPGRPPPAAVRALGVGCVTCHVTDEGIVLAAASPVGASADAEGRAPHPLRRSRDFAAGGACAGCHEFRFPLASGDDEGAFMQTTAREHGSSATPCAGCHMPPVEGRRSHAFGQARDPSWLREHLEVRVEPVGDRRLRVTLRQTAPGHAFPTGDLFRRLEIGADLRSADGEVLARSRRYLARHFERVPGRRERQLTGDDRVGGEPAVVELSWESPVPRAAVVAWWVSYQRVATVGAGTDPALARVESEVRLHSGVLALEPGYPRGP